MTNSLSTRHGATAPSPRVAHHKSLPPVLAALLFVTLAQAQQPTHTTLEPAALNKPAAPAIPWSDIGAKAGAQYSGDGLSVVATKEGARLECVFQKLRGEATANGLWLTSTATNQSKDRFRVTASQVGRVVQAMSVPLPTIGRVEVNGNTVRFVRPTLVEEYSVSMDGVRQDFVVMEKPGGASVPASRLTSSLAPEADGELRVELSVTGARVEPTAYGAQLVLEESGRKIAYSRLRVTDAMGKELAARMEVTGKSEIRNPKSEMRLAVVVEDTQAKYPIRIDPTFSDADWISMGDVPGANGPVYAAAMDGLGNLYIGGYFVLVGDVFATNIAKWNGSAWTALSSGMNGAVAALAVSDGDLYAGGWFTTAGDSTANYIAKWNGSSWSALGSGVNNSVTALAVSGSALYAGGSFTTAGATNANCIAKWDGNSWSALGSGMGGQNADVRALAMSGSSLFAGGSFTTAGGSNANYVARWNGSNWSAVGLGMDSYVWALATWRNTLYAGGLFTKAGGTNVSFIAKWDGTNWLALGAGLNSLATGLAVSDNSLFASGLFTTAGGSNANYIARWNGNNWSAVGSGMNDYVSALTGLGTDLYAAGAFTTAGGRAANHVAKWDESKWSALNSSLGSGMSARVNALVVSGGEVHAGGAFRSVGGIAADRVAKWNGNSWSAPGAGVGGQSTEVQALAVSGSNVYVGGTFSTVGGTNAMYIAKWDGNRWSTLGSGMGGMGAQVPEVRALAVSGTNLFAGGSFTTAGGSNASYVGQWNGSNWSAVGRGMNGRVIALTTSGSNVYAGGEFTRATNANGVAVTVNRIARWNGSSWSALGLGMDSAVYALAVSGSNLYVGGSFTRATNAGGIAAAVNRIASWNGSTWSALGSGVNNRVQALAVSGSNLYAGGEFTNAGGSTANYIAKWNGSVWSTLGSGMNYPVYALAASAIELYVGGDFTRAGDNISTYIARVVVFNFPPTDIVLSSDSIAENQPAGSSICQINAIDANVGDTHTFTLVNGAGDSDNASFTIIGNHLHSATAFDFETQNSHSVRIRATDADGLAFERFFTITVLDVPEPPVITMHPQSQTVMEGDAVTFNVAADGEPTPSFQWFKNTTAIFGATDSSYSIFNVQTSDAGAYWVVASNTAGSATSSRALLNVRRAPVVSSICHPIANTASLDEFARSSASDGTNFLVGVRGAPGNPAAVAWQRIAPDGSRLNSLVTNGRNVGQVPENNLPSGAPWMAFGGGRYLIAWTDADLGNDVRGQFLSTSGGVLSSPFSIAPETDEDEDTIGVASDGTNFLVIWSSPSGLHGRLVSPAGLSNRLDFTTAEVKGEAGVGYGGGKYLVSWVERPEGGSYEAHACLVSPEGQKNDVPLLSEHASHSHNPVNVSYGAGQFLVVWHHSTSQFADMNLRGRVVEPDGNLPGEELPLVDGPNDDLAFGASLIFDGRYFLLVWTDLSDLSGSPSNSEGAVMGQYWTRDGTALTEPFAVTERAVGRFSVGLSAGNGNSLLVVHDNIFTDQADLCAKFISLPPAVGPLLLVPGPVENNEFHLDLFGPPGAMAVVDASPNLSSWTPVRTNTLPTGPLSLRLPTGANSFQFFRGRLP